MKKGFLFWLLSLGAASVVIFAGCEGDGDDGSPTSPPTVDITGTWNLSYAGEEQQGTAIFPVTQSGNDLTGAGLNGSISGNAVSIKLNIEGTDFRLSGTAMDSSNMNGTFQNDKDNGTWIATRRF